MPFIAFICTYKSDRMSIWKNERTFNVNLLNFFWKATMHYATLTGMRCLPTGLLNFSKRPANAAQQCGQVPFSVS